MKFGAGLALMNGGGRPDYEVYRSALELGLEVETLGFDSIWTVEHHFTGHSPVPNALQMLSYIAAKTDKLLLGTAVIVLPWHHPVRVAEEIAALDVLSGGRTLLGFGRGTSAGEYNGFQIPMEQSRERFAEAVRIIRLGLSQPRFSYNGTFFQIPEIAVRPRPISNPEQRMYGAATSPESTDLMAELGLGLLISPDRDLEQGRKQIRGYHEILHRSSKPLVTPPPACHLYVSVATTLENARARAERHMRPMIAMLDRHYGVSKRSLAGVKSYERYAADGSSGSLWEVSQRDTLVRAFMDRHLVGTPHQCIVRLREMQEELGVEHFIGEFSYGDMPQAECWENMKLFANTVLPALNGP
ncbi:LLM class flavin-dependent oxidoreductase (plasmid) [Paraburkholderia sp. PREW-6R]|uniref:LLM class flavin-dependent oxidoreductase n=1 Tax=Paraburkholderia sp. PREW-6R TaxID=3141544 RepID=UPI0031F567E8